MRRLLVLTGLLCVCVFFLAACGAGSIPQTGGSSSTVVMSDYKFSPATVTVPAGQTVTLNLTNNGAAAHTWVVMKTPISGSFTSADQANVLFDSQQIGPGQSKTVTFTAPTTPGNYQVVCAMPGHFENGMVGQLVVK